MDALGCRRTLLHASTGDRRQKVSACVRACPSRPAPRAPLHLPIAERPSSPARAASARAASSRSSCGAAAASEGIGQRRLVEAPRPEAFQRVAHSPRSQRRGLPCPAPQFEPHLTALHTCVPTKPQAAGRAPRPPPAPAPNLPPHPTTAPRTAP
ncbi:MAG: hypothetical protein J3K34DRAFT_193939 [Monoraphidium minutum]|nr:MAG: hypothetical protein J3K34DRAFT_193939 [Monoraphidium minutum]